MSSLCRRNVVVMALAFGAAGTVGLPAGLIALAAPTTQPAEPSGQTYSITGTVREGATPAVGAHVYLLKRAGHRPTTQPGDSDQADSPARGAGRAAKILGVGSGAHEGQMRGHIVAETETDSNGNFTLTDVPPGRYLIAAHAPKEGAAHQPIVVGPNAQPSIILELQRHQRPTTAPST